MRKRGFDSQDSRWFSPTELVKLRQANHDITWLINRGYKFENSVTFVSNRFLFSNRQREALKRTICTKQQRVTRAAKKQSLTKLKDGPIYIDGFNLIITLEVALSRGTLVVGNDGCLRDLAGLRGTYKLIEQTDQALRLIADFLNRYDVPKVIFYLDAPVSNSKNLKSRILSIMNLFCIPTEVELVPNADCVLSKRERIVSTDAILLDQCISYFDLSQSIIHHYLKTLEVIDFSLLQGGEADD